MGASSRYRSFQYFPYLEAEGISCEVLPFFSDAYLTARYRNGHPSVRHVLSAFCRRFWATRKFNTFDFIVVEKELFPYIPAIIEKWILKRARVYSLDFDDALFHIYDEHPNPFIRKFVAKKHFILMKNAALVTVGNPYIAEYATKYSRHVKMLPTVIDISKYPFCPEPEGKFTVGWIGTPNTTRYLSLIKDALKKFFEVRDGRLLLIGANKDFIMEGVPFKILSWNEDEEASFLEQINVGIMPLPDKPLERGKSALKILQYMASGRPVIASPVGINAMIVNKGIGLLATSEREWYSNLLHLADDSTLRKRMGSNGRTLVEEHYSLERWAKNYARFLKTTFEGGTISCRG